MQRYRLANNGLSLPNQSAPDWQRVQAAMARPTMTPAEALRCAPGTTVKVRGVARPGDAGPLTAPVSGQQCAWYRSYVQPGNWTLQPLPRAGCFSDIMLVAQSRGTFWRRTEATDEISESPFLVAGPDGAALRVDPRQADVNSGDVARNRVVSSRFGFLQQLLIEFTLPLGAEVVLLAVMGPGGELVAGPKDFVFVSTRTDARIVDRAAHGANEHATSMSMFRFIRGGNRVVHVLGLVNRIIGVATILVVLIFLIWVLTAL